ncbi:nucleotide exchange factor GrpE [Mediterraneibacter gnavus]|uniref:Protein GrpE n=1 Tax=Mediterraneibacter gnavus TaxID=33038 RepID=A0A9X3HE15_MEDGN|nr:nucleotide exchange factor GrpE [Mediterraneibacter gnavus]MDU6436059.1 nucleotide exchange factor GrpE [Lachnospiraceae bacterium]MCZ7692823.1 nucleotide exchange factor GrpE [Mediterraneibacter gnavus]MCZ7734465.1 nucleotide exchange factor GrpE [Mediterraneibacter gnavus]MDC6146038.1 nucleotide exchange factor GrpE [Mediterraneibacter gnavus]MDE1199455.1 nucleotide exchange factor GrpE [Mediterraneibacter gnavus]
MSKEEMVKEAVEEAKAKAYKEAEEQDTEETVEEAAEEAAEPTEETEGSEEGSGFMKKFGRKNKKDKKDEKIEELTDRLTRQMAEFDNFRKRTEKEKSQMYEIGAKDIIEKILPVVDNFERGIAAVPEEEKSNPFAEGMEKIYKQLMTTLEEIGVKPIEAVDQEFDPDFHNAVMHVEDEEVGENIITEEFQKGYLYRDSVVRHSMVKVAN